MSGRLPYCHWREGTSHRDEPPRPWQRGAYVSTAVIADEIWIVVAVGKSGDLRSVPMADVRFPDMGAEPE